MAALFNVGRVLAEYALSRVAIGSPPIPQSVTIQIDVDDMFWEIEEKKEWAGERAKENALSSTLRAAGSRRDNLLRPISTKEQMEKCEANMKFSVPLLHRSWAQKHCSTYKLVYKPKYSDHKICIIFDNVLEFS